MNILKLIEKHMDSMKEAWEKYDTAHENLIKTIDSFCEEGEREDKE